MEGNFSDRTLLSAQRREGVCRIAAALPDFPAREVVTGLLSTGSREKTRQAIQIIIAETKGFWSKEYQDWQPLHPALTRKIDKRQHLISSKLRRLVCKIEHLLGEYDSQINVA